MSEKTKLDLLKSQLKDKFQQYGKVVDIVAHKNIRMRGQAFVVFDSIETAQKAHSDIENHTLDGTKLKVQFANTKSDATVKSYDSPSLTLEHLQERGLRKKLFKKDFNRVKKKSYKAKNSGAKKTKKVKKEELLPPNKLLFLQHLPENVQQSTVEEIFNKFEGFVEVRLVAVRKLGFVEFDTEEHAIVAREATKGLVLEDNPVSVTYAKK